MKRQKLIQHLTQHGCVLAREGARHSIYINQSGGQTTVPRHPDIPDYTVKSICRQLGIPEVGHN
ncbi:MAG: type II toxin-antitoxin system HicA family toxin [Salinivirgaceae bacterium]|nr:type II toxin-antitoxin system HicA family toxin [Salinivirgaceae bacterium]